MVLSMVRWMCKPAIVTGAGSGIGAAVTVALISCGIRVIGLDLCKDKMEELAKKLSCKYGNTSLFPVQCDMTKEDQILQAFEWTKTNFGSPYILVNNAGIAVNETLLNGKTESWRKMLDTNVLGLSIATREAIKHMRESCIEGHIIHINSIFGHQALPIPNLKMYTASKFAVTALTELLRQDLNLIGSTIKITSISPGLVATALWESSGLAAAPEIAATLKTYPMLQPEDIADAVVYALSTPPCVQVHEVTVKPLGEVF